MSEQPSIFVIDSMAYIFRAFYGIRANMHSQDGLPTNALFGFINSFENIIRDFNPSQIVAVFDAGSETFRNEMYAEYKANRKECPEELKPQFDLVKEYIALRGIPLLIQKGFEADDIIATVATQATGAHIKTVICSGDKDLMQLVNDHTYICHTHKDNLMIDAEKVFKIMGVRPDQIVDYLSICGDSADNIPGLPGIGPKGASKLLAEFNDLETILASHDKIKGKKQSETIREKADLAHLSKSLVILKDEMTLEKTYDELIPTQPDFEGLADFYERMGFSRFLRDLPKIQSAYEGNSKPNLKQSLKSGGPVTLRVETFAPRPFQHEILKLKAEFENGLEFDVLEESTHLGKTTEEIFFALKNTFIDCELTLVSENHTIIPEDLKSKRKCILTWEWLAASWLHDIEIGIEQISSHHLPLIQEHLYLNAQFADLLATATVEYNSQRHDYNIIQSITELQQILKKISDSGQAISFDTETTGLDVRTAQIVGLGLAIQDHHAWYIPFNSSLDKDTIITELKPFFANSELRFFAQNAKFDLQMLHYAGIQVNNIDFDTLVASFICNPSRQFHDLDSLALHYLNYRKISTVSLIGKGKKQITMAELPIEKVATYCCEDVDITLRLRTELEAELHRRGLRDLFDSMDIPLVPVLSEMENHGISVNLSRLETISTEFSQERLKCEEQIYALAGHEFNINSPKQVGTVLFEEMGLKAGKKTATGYSTSADVLENLAPDSEIVRVILRHRTLSKLISTYADALPKEVSPLDDRIHTRFSQTTAATGRLASTQPNLQNIPTRTEEGKSIRSAFIAAEGHNFLSCDYSQIELRIMAELSQDPGLLEAFSKDLDVHSYTASLVFDTDLNEITKQQRYAAKAVNFGIMFGQGPYGLAKEIGVSADEAKQFISNYFKRYPDVQKFMSQCVEDAREKGYSETSFGRRRYLPEMLSSNGRIRSGAERISVNSPIQGTAADIIKIAMINVSKELHKRQLKSKMLLQIHDELLFEVPDDELDIMKELIPKIMTDIPSIKVPLKVDSAIAKSWDQCD
ncbi:DNA polymerase I [Lentisphaera profundi]|uniref:DNA polymerase I n=1 Tax=Lentisphaera profundi TaxID=1658616 RepID=A0ABY7VNG4_9BACT|nr:DNA polymerase I [Lentisphaera profundi]WDE95660.1 DNA polymerase I [Lentisphaera profundi]